MKQPWRSHYNAICGDWVAKHNRTTRNGVGNCSSKTGWISTPERKKDDFEALFKRIFRRKITSAKNAFRARLPSKLHRQLIHQHHLQSHLQGNDPTVANHNGIPSATHPPAPLAIPFTLRERSYSYKSHWNSVDRKCTKHRWNPIYNAEPIRDRSDHDPPMIRPHTRPSRTRRTAEVDHRRSGTDFVWKNIGFRASAISQKRISCETSSKTPSATPPPAPLAIPFTVRERSYSCKSQWTSIGNSSTSTTCNPIYIAGTILQLQITMELCRPQMHETQVKPHLQCGTDPRPIQTWSAHDPTTHETVSHPSHRRGRSSTFGDGLCMEKHRVSCICYLSKTHFVRDFLQNSIGNSSTSTTCNPIYIAWTILQLQITMEFCRPHMHEKHLKPHLHCGTDPRPIRPWSAHDPTTHETVSHPSHRRGRSSTFGDGLCMEKHRVSCICYLSKTHFVRDFLQNSIGNSSTSTTCNPIYIAGTILQLQITMEFCRPHMHEKHLKPHLQCGTDPRMIRELSENDPTTHETVSHPSHRRGRSSTFGDGLCMEKHRVSCICYLSKTHFVRDFLQNSISNSSTSTTCNPIYIAWTILQLQITMEFCRPHMHEKHLKPHLQCGTDPRMIRELSENDPTTHETVSHPSHRRGRSSTFGDGLCMEKHRVSCICYLSKTHFVRDFLQNSIGNSSTSTTCNPIYIAGTISLTNSFPNELFLC